MSVNSSLQQISGGIASIIAGLIVFQSADGKLQHYDTLGYIVVASVIFTIVLMRYVNRFVRQKTLSEVSLKNNEEINIQITGGKPAETGT